MAVSCKRVSSHTHKHLFKHLTLTGLWATEATMPMRMITFRRCATDASCGEQGEYKSVMIIVTPCRSDLSARGLSPLSHLADGRLTLALVRRCSIAQYLRFLIAIPRTGGLLPAVPSSAAFGLPSCLCCNIIHGPCLQNRVFCRRSCRRTIRVHASRDSHLCPALCLGGAGSIVDPWMHCCLCG